jgi:hypothetical protein
MTNLGTVFPSFTLLSGGRYNPIDDFYYAYEEKPLDQQSADLFCHEQYGGRLVDPSSELETRFTVYTVAAAAR